MSSLRTPTAFDSPPEVHQCSTSTDSAACTADTPHIRPAAHRAPMIARNFIAYLLQTPEQKNEWPLMSPGCCGWFKQAKHWAIEHGRAHALRHVPADRFSAAGSSRDEWFGMQLTVSSFDFCLPASRAADSRCLARQLGADPAGGSAPRLSVRAAGACWHVPTRNVR